MSKHEKIDKLDKHTKLNIQDKPLNTDTDTRLNTDAKTEKTSKTHFHTESATIKKPHLILQTNQDDELDFSEYRVDTANERKLGYSQFQSAFSLQNSSKAVSFTKSDRFKLVYRKPESDSIFSFNSTLNKRFTTQGYSSKWDLVNRKNVPGPKYNLSGSSFFNKNKATSIGKKIPTRYETFTPGVGEYDVLRNMEESKERERIKVAIKGRHGFFYDDDLKMKKFCVSPQNYLVNYKPVFNLRYTKVSFGKGEKFDYIDSRKSYPGPGSYNLPSVFDKSRKSKPALN